MLEADAPVECSIARVMYEARRFNDAPDIFRGLISEKYTFTVDAQRVIVATWKEVVTPPRFSVLNMKRIDKPQIPVAVNGVQKRLLEVLDDVIGVMVNVFLPGASYEVFLGELHNDVADFQRYKLECGEIPDSDTVANEQRARIMLFHWGRNRLHRRIA